MEELNAQMEEAKDEAAGIKKLILKSDTYMKYDPVIQQMNKKFLSYDLELMGLSYIQTFSTRLESTTQVFAYGHDLFLVRTQPDMRYDLLDEDFNYYALFAFIGVLIIFNLGFTQFLKKRQNTKTFLLH